MCTRHRSPGYQLSPSLSDCEQRKWSRESGKRQRVRCQARVRALDEKLADPAFPRPLSRPSYLLRFLPYQSPWLLHQGSIHSVHLVVETARVAQVVARTVSSPKRSGNCAAIYALASLRKVFRLDVVHCAICTVSISNLRSSCRS